MVDILALGQDLWVEKSPGWFVIGHGTSFSASIISSYLCKLMINKHITPNEAVAEVCFPMFEG